MPIPLPFASPCVPSFPIPNRIATSINPNDHMSDTFAEVFDIVTLISALHRILEEERNSFEIGKYDL